MKQTIYIKNMVCPRCIAAVRSIFIMAKVIVIDVKLGHVSLTKPLNIQQEKTISELLNLAGFQILENKNTQIVAEIKAILIHQIHHQTEAIAINYSTLLAEALHYDYAHLSRIFSTEEGQTIEKYIQAQKIEKIKEFLTYDELSLSEIAYQMHYSSAAHLSTQFKKVTGTTPSNFKHSSQNRKGIDTI